VRIARWYEILTERFLREKKWELAWTIGNTTVEAYTKNDGTVDNEGALAVLHAVQTELDTLEDQFDPEVYTWLDEKVRITIMDFKVWTVADFEYFLKTTEKYTTFVTLGKMFRKDPPFEGAAWSFTEE